MNPNNRRYFLAAAGAAAIRPVFAAQDQVRVGIIGVGGRGTALLRVTAQTPKAVLTHVCDVDPARLEKAQQLAFQSGAAGVKASADMRRLLADRDVDAVIIATPDHWHAPAAILACDAGKDVYVEKPVSHNLREGRLLVEAARRNQRIVQAGLQSRSRATTIKAIEIARSGRLGRVLMAKAWNTQLRRNIGRKPDSPPPPGLDYDTWVGPAPMIPFNENRFHYDWHWHWNFGTGDMGNDGAHQIDIARWALGESAPRRVSGMGAKLFFDDDQQTPDTMNLTFDFGGKAIQWEMRIWTPYPLEGIDNGVAVYGSGGVMHIGDWTGPWGYKVFDRKGALVEHVEENEPERHIQNFIECVISRKKPNCEIEEGHLSTALCHLGNICARTGRNLNYDGKTESILSDPEAQAMTRRQYRPHWGTPK
ncbi:MAG: Gfo/Idh/MocA family oxidoreductase [Acidobacteriia bacterium]|nr:Gfo/Idh/MocA family oxidoreductase [Terriglobia bacterium]